ncbi:MAG: glycosyltransferase family 4 protein [Candidatus Rokuibacteriota bacterium]
MTLRVLHVITRLTLGGSSENTVGGILALERAGYACALAVGFAGSETEVLEDARRRGCRLVDVPALRREVAPVADLRALRQLLDVIRLERPDIVHTHTSKAGFVGRLAARITRVPAVIHQPHGHVFYGYWGPARTAVFTSLERLAARWTDLVITLTDRGIEEHLARGIGSRELYATVPSGVPTDALRARAPHRDAARARHGVSPDAFVIAALGRFVRIKGFDLLVAAWPRVVEALPQARLLLIGDGPERVTLEAQARDLGVAERLRVTGATPDVAGWLAAADALAAPSRNEGMGRALVEAMALGLPVIGAAVGGIPSVVDDGRSGRLVPPEDPKALAAAVIELGRDPALRARLGEGAVARAESFSTAVADRALVAAYEALARARVLT